MSRIRRPNLRYPSAGTPRVSPTKRLAPWILALLALLAVWQGDLRAAAQSVRHSSAPLQRRVDARSAAVDYSDGQVSGENIFGDIFEDDGAWVEEDVRLSRRGVGPGFYSSCGLLPLGNWEVRGEYLLWWGKGDRVPALVTTSPAGTLRTAAGVLGENTDVLFGDGPLNNQTRSGARITLDYWFGSDYATAVEASYVGLGDHTESYAATSTGTPILARPYYNISDAHQDSGLIAFPGVQTGTVKITDRTEFQSAELLLRQNWLRQDGVRLDCLAGYRYLKLGDDLALDESGISTDPESLVPVGSRLVLSDSFQTRNQFHGADLGLLAQWHRSRWSVDLLLKLALGSTRSRVTIGGATEISAPDQTPVAYSGAFLAQKTNIGQYDRTAFGVIPELGASLGYDLTQRLRLTAGYSLLCWSSVARPGEQIDANLNPTQFPPGTLTGLARPQYHFATSSYWIQGVTAGLDFRF